MKRIEKQQRSSTMVSGDQINGDSREEDHVPVLLAGLEYSRGLSGWRIAAQPHHAFGGKPGYTAALHRQGAHLARCFRQEHQLFASVLDSADEPKASAPLGRKATSEEIPTAGPGLVDRP